jgi:Uma2 family endonuclease
MLVEAMPVQYEPMTVAAYLKQPATEYGQRDELEFGWIVREPTANAEWHELDVSSLLSLLRVHLRERALGSVFGSVSVILDKAKALVVEPDISVVLADRFGIVRGQLWGAPNITIEVASPSTRRRDRGAKLSWYRAYGVQECWLVDARKGVIEVHRMRLPPDKAGRVFRGDEVVETEVLPEFRLPVSQLLAHEEREQIARFSYDKPGS